MVTVILFVYGSCLGSLIVALAWRYAQQASYWSPASHCDSCQQPLKYWQLVPILSYLLLRGRCHFCHAPIPFTALLVEIISGLVATTISDNFSLRVTLWLILWGFAALCDAQTLTFPGWVTWVTAGLALVGQPPMIWGIGLGLLFLIHRLWPHWHSPTIGDGDLEMLVSAGLLWGVTITAQWLIIACLLAISRARTTDRLPFLPYLTTAATGHWLITVILTSSW